MKRRPNKQAAAVMAQSLLTTLTSVEWCKAFDEEDRAWLLLLDLCDALHPLGAVTVPSRARVVEMLKRMERDEEIRRAFDGRNYAELATRHRMTVRTIRTIIGTRGWHPRR